MKISVKKIDALRREISFDVPRERVDIKFEEVLSNIARHAVIKGFRRGKAPRHLVAAAHGDAAREEMLKRLIPEIFQEGVIQEKLDPVDLPAIDQVGFKEGALQFRATIDIRPVVEVKDYKGVKLIKKTVAVADEEVVKSLDFLRKGRGLDESAPVDDTLAKGMGFPSLEELKSLVRRNLEADKERQNRHDVEVQLIDALIKTSKLDVPRSLVDRQLEGRVDEFARRLKTFGMKDEDIMKKVQAAEKDLKEAAEKDVRTFLILRKIAEIEKLDAAEPGKNENISAKVIEFLFKEAKWEEAK